MIFSNLLDFLSIALVIPIIALIQKKNIEDNQFSEIFNFFNFQIDIYSIVYLLIFFIVLKGIFSLIIIYLQTNYSVKLTNYFRTNVFYNYIYNDFESSFGEHSSLTYRNIVTEVNEFMSGYIRPILNITSSLILFLFMTALLFIVDYKSLIFILITLLIFYLLIKFFLSHRLKKLGFDRLEKDTEYYKLLGNTFEFIKDIKFFNIQKIYIKKLSKILHRQLYINRMRAVLNHSPRVVFEVVFVIIFSIFLLYNYDNEKILIILGVYAAAALRVFPAVNNISDAYQKIKFSESTFKVIDENLKIHDILKENKKFDYKKNILINNLNFKYKINKEYTLRDISLSITGKDKIGIFGESGSGKSTLLNLMLGFLEAENIKSIKSNDISIYKSKNSWREKISYVPQRVVILDQSLKSNIILSAPFKEFNENKYRQAIEKSGLSSVIEKLKDKDETFLGENGDKISMGEKQRVGIARAIYRDAEIVIMDEMSNFLDEKNKKEIIENIQNHFKDKIIIMVSHDKEILSYSNKIYELKDKKLNLLKK